MIIPTINPIRFSGSGVNESRTANAYYRDYYQKYQRSDSTGIQILLDQNEANNWQLKVYDEYNISVQAQLDKKTLTDKIANTVIVEWLIHFSQFEEGMYKFCLIDNENVCYSDYICVKDEHPFTKLLTYQNSTNEQNLAFSTGVVFNLRVEAQTYASLVPKSMDSIYSDEQGAGQILSSTPYCNEIINIGGTLGIPDWLLKITNKIFSCDTLQLDGLNICRVEGAEFEPVSNDNYNLRSWNIEIVTADNQNVTIPEQQKGYSSCTWSGFVNILEGKCFNDFGNDFNADFNCNSGSVGTTWGGFVNILAKVDTNDFGHDFNNDFNWMNFNIDFNNDFK